MFNHKVKEGLELQPFFAPIFFAGCDSRVWKSQSCFWYDYRLKKAALIYI